MLFRGLRRLPAALIILALGACSNNPPVSPTPRATAPVTVAVTTAVLPQSTDTPIVLTATAQVTRINPATTQGAGPTTPVPATGTPTATPQPTLTPRPPGAWLLSPSTFDAIRAHTPVYFAANALSPAGLQRIELLINDQVVASADAHGATEYNLVYGWQTDVNGDYRVQVRAVDAGGNTLQSPTVVQPVRGGVDAIVNGTPVISPIGSMVSIPEGTFTMGRNDGPVEEQPAHSVHLSAYEIDRFPVTVEQFRDFVNRTKFKTSAEVANEPITRTWRIDDTPSRWEHPVRFVSWWDADAYCRAQGKRLPTEAEWEYAARGTDGRAYPWGNNFDKTRVPSGDTAPVGFYTSGASPFGVYDMAGNVWQWTDDWFDPLYYRSSPADNPHPAKNSDQKSMRGGGFNSSPDDLRVTRRIHNFPTTYHPDVGFRCVKAP